MSLMPTLTLWEGLFTVIRWLFVLWRFLVTLRRGIDRSAEVQQEAWALWGAFFCIALTFTFLLVVRHTSLFTAQFSIWSKEALIAITVLTGNLLGVFVCYKQAPNVRPRWNWPLYGCLLVLGIYILLWIAVEEYILRQSIKHYIDGIARPLFEFLVVLIGIRIILPATHWSRKHEEKTSMRLRFLFMIWTVRIIVVWMLNGIINSVALITGIPYIFYTPVYILSLTVFAFTFVNAYLMPKRYFVYLVKVVQAIQSFIAFVLIRSLEVLVARIRSREASPLDPTVVPRSFDEALYCSLIAVLDSHKPLKGQVDDLACLLGQKLNLVARPELNYHEVVGGLCRIALDMHFKNPGLATSIVVKLLLEIAQYGFASWARTGKSILSRVPVVQ